MSFDWHVPGLIVGQVAKRTGIAPSAVRWYADKALLPCERTAGNLRRFHSDVLCRVAMIRAAQKVGLTLVEIGQAHDALPPKTPPHGTTGTTLRSCSALCSTIASTTSSHYSTRWPSRMLQTPTGGRSTIADLAM